jgi:hypothetical protein
MNFIHFGFAVAGAAAMTLPIWIHLLLRQRAKPMDIGSIRFVKNVVRRTKSRQRIQRWLLLALRALAVLLLGLLFARPFLPATPADGRTREVAVLIDRSASMSAEHEDGSTAMDAARHRALQYVDSLGEQARVHIGLFDSSGVDSVTLAELPDAEPASTGTRFDEAFAWATDLLSSSIRTDRSLLVLSDLQRRGIEQTRMTQFPPDISVRIEDPAPAVAQNLEIESALPTQVELRPAVPVAVSIRLYNSGAFPVTNVLLTIQLNGPGGPLHATRSVSLAAGHRQSIELKLPVTEPGIYQGVALIDRDDPLPWDNRRHIAFEVRYPDRLLLIDGDPGRKPWENETYFVETALRLQTPIGEGPARTFEVQRLVWDRGSGFPDLAGYRLIVLANLGRFTQSDAERLRTFVHEGGNVLWFSGERTTTAVLDPLVRSGLLGSATFLPATDAIARVADFDSEHPALAPFADPQHGNLRSLSLKRLIPIESLAPDAEVLIRSRRWPLVVSRQSGKGHFVLVATSADRSWSDWPQNRLFVPLIRQIAAWLTGQLDSRQSVLTEVIKDADHVPGVELVDESFIVRNIEPAESDIGRLGAEQFRDAIGLPKERSVSFDSDEIKQFAPAGVARSDEKWPMVVWVLLGVLGLELLLASRVHE